MQLFVIFDKIFLVMKMKVINDPFFELTKTQINKIYSLLGVHTYTFIKGQEILPTMKYQNIIVILLKGNAQIIYTEYNGNEIVLEKLHENDLYGSIFSGVNNENCQVMAKEDTKVLVIDYDNLINSNNLKHNYFNIFLRNIFDIINNKFNDSAERIRILEKKQIRDKLLEYFEIQYKKSHSRKIFMPFSLKDLADYLAVNRSAMFRELRHLKDEKFIQVKNNIILLLYK